MEHTKKYVIEKVLGFEYIDDFDNQNLIKLIDKRIDYSFYTNFNVLTVNNIYNFFKASLDGITTDIKTKYIITYKLKSFVPNLVKMNKDLCNECFRFNHECKFSHYTVNSLDIVHLLKDIPSYYYANFIVDGYYLKLSNKIIERRFNKNKLFQKYFNNANEYKKFWDNNTIFVCTTKRITDTNISNYLRYCFNLTLSLEDGKGILTDMPNLSIFLRIK